MARWPGPQPGSKEESCSCVCWGPQFRRNWGSAGAKRRRNPGRRGRTPRSVWQPPGQAPPNVSRRGLYLGVTLLRGGWTPPAIEAGPKGPHGTRLDSGTLRKEFARRLQGSTGFSAPGSAVFGLEWGCFWAVRPARARRAFGGKGRAAQRLDLRVRPVGGWPRQPFRAGLSVLL